jgi:hypothetical protein
MLFAWAGAREVRRNMPKPANRKNKSAANISIKGENIVFGDVNIKNGSFQQKVEKKADLKELEKLFTRLGRQVDEHLEGQNKDDARVALQNIEQEASKGPEADESKIDRWVKFLSEIAPDIVDVMLAALSGPGTAFTTILKKVATRAKAESPK